MFPLNGNSTTTALADGATFTGEWYDVTKHGYSNLVVVGITDQDGSLYVDFSTDGSNSDETHTYAVVADTTEKQIVTVSARYVRVRFTNSGGSAQTYIRLSASLSDSNLSTSTGGGGGGDASAALQEDGNASLVSIDGKLPALNGYTSSGTITGGGQIVCTTTTHGQNTMGIVCSGTWAGLIAVQGTIDGSTWQLVPIYDYGSRTTQFYISTSDNATSAIGGFQTVRLIAVALTSGTANCYVNINNGISPVPVTSVAPGQFYATVNIRDGNNSAFVKGQTTMSDSLPVVLPSDQRLETRAYSMATMVDEASDTVTYVGEASVGASVSSSSWKIKKITISGSVTAIQWADGNSSFDNVWDDRASLTYT